MLSDHIFALSVKNRVCTNKRFLFCRTHSPYGVKKVNTNEINTARIYLYSASIIT